MVQNSEVFVCLNSLNTFESARPPKSFLSFSALWGTLSTLLQYSVFSRTRYKIPPMSEIVRVLRTLECGVVQPSKGKGKGSPYSITERRVPELIPVLGSQRADDVSHKPGGRLPLLSARPAVTPATLNRAATNFAAW